MFFNVVSCLVPWCASMARTSLILLLIYNQQALQSVAGPSLQQLSVSVVAKLRVQQLLLVILFNKQQRFVKEMKCCCILGWSTPA